MTYNEIRAELDASYARAYALAEENGGEISFDLEEELSRLEGDLTEKKSAVLAWYCSVKDELQGAEHRALLLKHRVQSLKNRMERAEQYLQYVLGGEPWEDEEHEVKFTRSEGVVITCEDAIPSEYMTRKETFAPNKAAIKKAIKSGVVIDGASIEERKNLKVL